MARFVQEEIAAIHACEKAAAAKNFRWLESSRELFDRFNAKLGRYWPERAKEDEMKFETDAFAKWAGPLSKRLLMAEGSDADICALLHKTDLEILNAQDRPQISFQSNRTHIAPMGQSRKDLAAGEGVE